MTTDQFRTPTKNHEKEYADDLTLLGIENNIKTRFKKENLANRSCGSNSRRFPFQVKKEDLVKSFIQINGCIVLVSPDAGGYSTNSFVLRSQKFC